MNKKFIYNLSKRVITKQSLPMTLSDLVGHSVMSVRANSVTQQSTNICPAKLTVTIIRSTVNQQSNNAGQHQRG